MSIRIACCVAALTAGVTLADMIIDFDAASANVSGAFDLPQRSMDSDTGYLRQYNWGDGDGMHLFNVDTASGSGTPAYYGGYSVTNPAGSATLAYRLHDDPGSWPNVAMSFMNGGSSDANTSYHWMNTLFRKDQFLAGGDAQTVFMDSASTISVHWVQDGSMNNPELRFMIRDGDQYYISEYSTALADDAAYSLTDFNNNSAAGKRWGIYNPTATEFGIPDSLPTFSAMNFTNVQAVGFVAEAERGWSQQWGWDTFNVSASVVPEPGSIGLILVGVLAIRLRRRRRA